MTQGTNARKRKPQACTPEQHPPKPFKHEVKPKQHGPEGRCRYHCLKRVDRNMACESGTSNTVSRT